MSKSKWSKLNTLRCLGMPKNRRSKVDKLHYELNVLLRKDSEEVFGKVGVMADNVQTIYVDSFQILKINKKFISYSITISCNLAPDFNDKQRRVKMNKVMKAVMGSIDKMSFLKNEDRVDVHFRFDVCAGRQKNNEDGKWIKTGYL